MDCKSDGTLYWKFDSRVSIIALGKERPKGIASLVPRPLPVFSILYTHRKRRQAGQESARSLFPPPPREPGYEARIRWMPPHHFHDPVTYRSATHNYFTRSDAPENYNTCESSTVDRITLAVPQTERVKLMMTCHRDLPGPRPVSFRVKSLILSQAPKLTVHVMNTSQMLYIATFAESHSYSGIL